MATIDTARFFKQDTFSDVTIKFGDRELPAHKMILSSKSEYFNDLIVKQSTVDSNRTCIELKGDDPDAVEAMVRYLYSFDYVPNALREGAGNNSTWDDHLNVAVVADKYGIADLKEKALTNLKHHVSGMDHANELTKFISRYSCYPNMDHEIDNTIETAVDENFPALFDIPEFWTVYDKVTEKKELLCEKHFLALLKKPGFRNIVKADGVLGLKLLDRVAPEPGCVEKTLWQCGTCKRLRTQSGDIPDHSVLGCAAYIGRSRCFGKLVLIGRAWVRKAYA